MSRMRIFITRAVILAVAFSALVGCARLSDSHGYVPDDELLENVQVGVDTKETTSRILGRPAVLGLVDNNGWYYVRSDYERFLWRKPKEINREVLVVSFSESGQVENIERFGLEDGQVVALSRRVTTSNTRGVGFLRQLFSNLGNFNPADFIGSDN